MVSGMFMTETKPPRSLLQRAALLSSAAGLACLGACGGTGSTSADPGSTSDVASLRTPTSAPARATAAATAAERPLIRLDASVEDRTRLQDLYIDCLWENGFPKQGAVKGPNGGYPSSLAEFDLDPEVEAAIEKNCAAKQPESPFDRARRLDPDFADHVRAEVKCLNENGITAVIEDGGPALVDGLPSESKGHWLEDCNRKAFAGYYATLE